MYIYGDSHVSLFTGEDKLLDVYKDGDNWAKSNIDNTFLICRIGPYTAYNVKNKKDVLEDIQKRIPKGSHILLSFGEIDCRGHLHKHKNISETVGRYFEFIDSLKDYKISLYLPSATGTFEIHAEGTPQERNIMTKEFNRQCSIECDKRNIKHISLFDYLVYGNMSSRDEFYLDEIHLNQKTLPFLKEELKKL